jgi:hypothetical protein
MTPMETPSLWAPFRGLALLVALQACSSSAPAPTSSAGVDAGEVQDGNAQTPPMGAPNVVAWLATGQYLKWHCEPAIHAARGPSVHTPFDRVCSNDVLSAAAADGGTGPWPQGAAEVKEIYMAITDATPTGGYAVSLKTGADSAGGAGLTHRSNTPRVDACSRALSEAAPPARSRDSRTDFGAALRSCTMDQLELVAQTARRLSPSASSTAATSRWFHRNARGNGPPAAALCVTRRDVQRLTRHTLKVGR